MIQLEPTPLAGHGLRLEPLTLAHCPGLRAAAAEGELWRLFFTSVPEPTETEDYVARALAGQAAGHMLPWAVLEATSGQVLGTTRFHDVVPALDRVEIGYTWYAQGQQRTHVNTSCKLLLLEFAFEAQGCAVVGFRTDGLNLRSQRAIEGLGAKRDGTLRHHGLRRDGSARDTVVYSILRAEWPSVRKHLETRLWRHERSGA